MSAILMTDGLANIDHLDFTAAHDPCAEGMAALLIDDADYFVLEAVLSGNAAANELDVAHVHAGTHDISGLHDGLDRNVASSDERTFNQVVHRPRTPRIVQ